MSGIMIEVATLKKLLSRSSCEFILALILGTAVEPGMSQPVDKGEKETQILNQKTTLVNLALKTLESYDFSEFSEGVTTFIETSVLNYLDDENPSIRKVAVKTCCSLSFS